VLKNIFSNSTLLEEGGVLEPAINLANKSLESITSHLLWSFGNECSTL